MNECTIKEISTYKKLTLLFYLVPVPSSWQNIEIGSNISESVENHLHEIMDNIEVYLTHG